MTKILVVGLDGGTLDLMTPWMNQGLLPTFDKLRKTGTHGPLQSTIPPYSAPAWVSISTGTNPGSHGIYDFFHTDTLTKTIVTTHNRNTPALWTYLTAYHKKSIIVNVPITYPPEPIHGIMISGLLTPSEHSTYTHPTTIKNDLTPEKLGHYEFEQAGADDVPKYLAARYNPQTLINMTNTSTQSHATVTSNLIKTNPDWDLAMVVFRGIDDVQHLLWHKPDALLTCYQQTDTCLNHLQHTAGPDTTTIIISDHGFGNAHKYLYPNNLLYNTGLLTTKTNPHTTNSGLAMTIYQKYSHALYFLVPLRRLMRTTLIQHLIPTNETSNVDYDHTQAVYPSICSGGIRITTKNTLTPQAYEHLRDTLITLFTTIKDPDTNKPIVTNAYRYEDIYGPDAVNGPLDIILEMESGYGLQSSMRPLPATPTTTDKVPKPLGIMASPAPDEWNGDHRRNGIFFIAGPGIKPGQHVTPSVLDIVPTILAAMNLPIPEPVEGSVITDAFTTPPTITRAPWNATKQKQEGLLTTREKERIVAIRAKR
jgi:predicted AlkP superfamily phosphohydrolase/phosphomutase